MADLTTLETVKTQLGIQSLDVDPVLSFLITAISAEVEGACGRTFGDPASGSETITGTDGDVIFTARYPVTAVGSLTVNGDAVSASTGYGEAGYYIDGGLVRLRYQVVRPADVIAITYTAGQTVPADLERAVVQLVGLAYEERKRLGTASMSAAGYSVTYLPTMWPRAVEQVVNRYRWIWPA